MVFLYRRPILDYWCETGEDLTHLIRHFLIHEIGHHFGFSDGRHGTDRKRRLAQSNISRAPHQIGISLVELVDGLVNGRRGYSFLAAAEVPHRRLDVVEDLADALILDQALDPGQRDYTNAAGHCRDPVE